MVLARFGRLGPLRLKIAAGLGLIGGLLAMGIALTEWATHSKLMSAGVVAPARVVDREALDTGRGRSSRKLTLDYQPEVKAGGKRITYRKEFTVSDEIDAATRMGAPIAVRFLPDDPTISEVVGNPTDLGEKFAISAGVLLFGIALIVYLARRRAPAART
jgi:hypothetical protein